MALSERQVFSIDQISARWGVDSDYVLNLVLTRQLAQALMLFGPARLLMTDGSGAHRPHPDTAVLPFQTGILVSTLETMPNPWVWPLAQVIRVYEFSGAGPAGRLSLQQFRDNDLARTLGWVIAFEENKTTVVGRDTMIVSYDDLSGYEATNGIDPTRTNGSHLARHTRDARKQRCRVVAEILWRRDQAATLVDIFRHEWIQLVACAGRHPTEKTFREWVKDLNPNRKPGRRPQ
jgi:hypothetical protein